MKCYHHNDLDGRCAGAIVYISEKIRGNGECEMIEVDYKDYIDISAINEGEKIYIVDFSFKPDVMKEVLKKTSNVIWIDHHKTAQAYNYGTRLDGLREFREKLYAGCELTWLYFYPNKEIPSWVKLIGDRDCWRWSLGKNAEFFNEGIKLYNTSPQSTLWEQFFWGGETNIIERIINEGRVCLRYRDNFCKDYIKSYSFETTFRGYKCLACGLYMFGSELFGEKFNDYDICISYEFLGDKWIISLYSQKIDVSLIAKEYGGGGHQNAAGFVSERLPFIKTPAS